VCVSLHVAYYGDAYPSYLYFGVKIESIEHVFYVEFDYRDNYDKYGLVRVRGG